MTTLNEKTMQTLENEIPKLAEGAAKQAYLQALATGSSVIRIVNNQLVETFADGSFKVIKQLIEPTKVKPGSKVRLQA